MLIRTLRPLKGLTKKGEIVRIPEGTYLDLEWKKAELLIKTGAAEPSNIPMQDIKSFMSAISDQKSNGQNVPKNFYVH